MPRSRRLTIALVGSFLVHTLVIVAWRADVVTAPRPPAAPLNVELRPPEPDRTFVIEEIKPVVQRRPVLPPPLAPRIDFEVLPAAEPDAEEPEPRRRTVLNLERPANWDALIEGKDDADVGSADLPFNPTLAQAVRSSRESRHRRVLLASRYQSVHGLADDVFGRSGPLGEEIKVKGRCYSLQETPELGSAPRWWATRCREPRDKPLKLDPLSYDARGRIVTDP